MGSCQPSRAEPLVPSTRAGQVDLPVSQPSELRPPGDSAGARGAAYSAKAWPGLCSDNSLPVLVAERRICDTVR
jgi:hypothetical protein